MTDQNFQNEQVVVTTQSEVQPSQNYKPYFYTAIVAIIAVAGLGYYLIPTQPTYNVQGIPDVATTTRPIEITQPTITTSGNTLSLVESGVILQTFTLSQQGEFALHVIPSQPPQPFITNQDINFDGYNDLGVLTSTGYAGVNYFYDYYLYNPTVKRFDKNESISGLGLLKIDTIKKQISSTLKSGSEYVTQTFNWNGNMFSQIVSEGPLKTGGRYPQDNVVERQSVVHNWKKYEDAAHKFSISYPIEWTFTPDVFHPDKDFFHMGFGPTESVTAKPLVVLRIYTTGYGQYIASRNDFERIVVDGVEGKIFKSLTDSGQLYVMVYVSKNSYQYELSTIGLNEEDETVKTFLEMISHFKFED